MILANLVMTLYGGNHMPQYYMIQWLSMTPVLVSGSSGSMLSGSSGS